MDVGIALGPAAFEHARAAGQPPDDVGGELFELLQEENKTPKLSARNRGIDLLDFTKVHSGRHLIGEPHLSVHSAHASAHFKVEFFYGDRDRSSVMMSFPGFGERPLEFG